MKLTCFLTKARRVTGRKVFSAIHPPTSSAATVPRTSRSVSIWLSSKAGGWDFVDCGYPNIANWTFELPLFSFDDLSDFVDFLLIRLISDIENCAV